jgi:hypothetical protein
MGTRRASRTNYLIPQRSQWVIIDSYKEGRRNVANLELSAKSIKGENGH